MKRTFGYIRLTHFKHKDHSSLNLVWIKTKNLKKSFKQLISIPIHQPSRWWFNAYQFLPMLSYSLACSYLLAMNPIPVRWWWRRNMIRSLWVVDTVITTSSNWEVRKVDTQLLWENEIENVQLNYFGMKWKTSIWFNIKLTVS